jgi:hypothetical protein
VAIEFEPLMWGDEEVLKRILRGGQSDAGFDLIVGSELMFLN